MRAVFRYIQKFVKEEFILVFALLAIVALVIGANRA